MSGRLRRSARNDDLGCCHWERSDAISLRAGTDTRVRVMDEGFRGFLERLRQAGQLVDLKQPVDIRHIATLVDQAETALFFHNVIGYDMPVVSGIIRSRERAMMSMDCATYREIEDRLQRAISNLIPPKLIN